MSAHTLGPWGALRSETGPWAIFGPDGAWVSTTSKRRWPAEDLANARLIAAAPELLDALERMAGAFAPHPRDDTEGWREEHEACELARAAIAKATGGAA